jgi:hypothetical protein
LPTKCSKRATKKLDKDDKIRMGQNVFEHDHNRSQNFAKHNKIVLNTFNPYSEVSKNNHTGDKQILEWRNKTKQY